MTSNAQEFAPMNSLRNPAQRPSVAGRFDADAAALARQAPDGAGKAGRSARSGSRRRVYRSPTSRNASAAGVVPCQVHDPDLWFADAPGDLERAKALCGGCPVRLACLTGALDRREPTGVWGGQILENGEIVTHKRPRGRPRKSGTTPERHQSWPFPAPAGPMNRPHATPLYGCRATV